MTKKLVKLVPLKAIDKLPEDIHITKDFEEIKDQLYTIDDKGNIFKLKLEDD